MMYEELNKISSHSEGRLCGTGEFGELGRSSKKPKNKKIPQRGLGVAQLEKIRIEEEVAANTVLPTTIKSSNFVNFSSTQLTSPSQISYPPFPSPPSVSFPLSHGGLCASNNKGDYSALPSIEDFHLNSFDVDWPLILPINGTLTSPKMWNAYDMNHYMETNDTSIDQQGVVSGLNVNFPYETSPVGPLPDIDIMPMKHHFQPSYNSMVNMPSLNSLPNNIFHTEPLSNQRYLRNLSSFWLGEEKVAHKKRPYHFPFDNMCPSLRRKLPRISHPLSGSDESSSFGNESCKNLDITVPIFREVPSLQTITMPESMLKRDNIQKGNSNVNFLSLSPPLATPLSPSSKYKRSYENGCLDGQNHFFSFMQSRKHQDTIKGVKKFCSENELKDHVDLDLKL